MCRPALCFPWLVIGEYILCLLVIFTTFLLTSAKLTSRILTGRNCPQARCLRSDSNLEEKRLGYVCNPRSLREGTETSRRMTDELGSRQRDLSTSSVTKRANGHWHAIIASSCRWSQREYKRQPVHRINHVFAEEPSRRPGCPAVVQQLWRRDVTSPFPPSGNEGYIRNRDVPFQSVTPSHVGWQTNWDPYQSATGAAPSSALCRPPDPSYKADDRTGLHREGRLLLSLEQPKQ